MITIFIVIVIINTTIASSPDAWSIQINVLRPPIRMDAMRNGHTVIAPDKADFDFEKTEMKYDSTGMFHWTPSRSLEECILVSAENANIDVDVTLKPKFSRTETRQQ